MGHTNKKKQKKKKNKKLYKYSILFLIIIGMTIFAMITPIFNIKEIKVEGYSKVDKETIISLSGLTIGENIFKNFKSDIENNIEEHSYIKEVTMKRVLPGTIGLKIIEREISYQIELIDGYIYIDNQGYILENNSKKENVPILIGMTTSQDELLNSKRLNIEDLKKLNTIIRIMDSVKAIEIDNLITTINVQDIDEYILYLRSEKKYVYLGDASNLNNKVLYIQMMLQEEKKKSGKMFINGDLNKGFRPYFREDIKEVNNKKGDKNE